MPRVTVELPCAGCEDLTGQEGAGQWKFLESLRSRSSYAIYSPRGQHYFHTYLTGQLGDATSFVIFV
jgi:hypothetical protein